MTRPLTPAQKNNLAYREWALARRQEHDASQSYHQTVSYGRPYFHHTDYELWAEQRNDIWVSQGHSEAVINPPAEPCFDKDTSYQHQPLSVEEQFNCFGNAEWVSQIGSSSTSYKVDKKKAALDRSLAAAFSPRAARNSECLSLDVTRYEDSDTPWLSNNTDPLEELAEAEAQELAAEHRAFLVGRIIPLLSDRERACLELSARGLARKEIARQLDCAELSVKTFLQRARVKGRNALA